MWYCHPAGLDHWYYKELDVNDSCFQLSSALLIVVRNDHRESLSEKRLQSVGFSIRSKVCAQMDTQYTKTRQVQMQGDAKSASTTYMYIHVDRSKVLAMAIV